MSTIKTIALAGVQRVVKEHGHYSETDVVGLVHALVSVWRVNQYVEAKTKEVVFDYCQDDLIAQTFWNAVGIELINVGNLVRSNFDTASFTSWAVTPFGILLEYKDDSASKH